MRKIGLIIGFLAVILLFYCEQEQKSPNSETPTCQYSSDCNDGNGCTIDTCQGGYCTYKKLKPECCMSDEECKNSQYCDVNGECICRADGCGDPCGKCSESYFCKDGRCVTCEETCGECQECEEGGYCVDLEKLWEITDSFSFGDDTKSHNYHATSCVEVSDVKQCPSNKGIIFTATLCDCWVELDLAVSKKSEQLKIGVKLGKDFVYSSLSYYPAKCEVYVNDIDSSEKYDFGASSSCDLRETEISLDGTDRKNAIKDGIINLAICCYDAYVNAQNPLAYIQVQSLTCEE